MAQYETWVERQIREATERGEFDDLPGAGKPLDLGDPDDPEWWTKRLMAREGLDFSDALPPTLALRREAATYPESLVDLASADAVREVIRDYNRRVVEDRLRPATGRAMPAVAPRLDVEDTVEQWRELREAWLAQRRMTEVVAQVAPPAPRPWWRRLRRRGS